MISENNKQFMQRFVERAINQKDIDAMDELVAEDFVEHVPFPGQGPGREGLKDVISSLVSAFPDLHWTVEEQIGEAEKVVSRFRMTGTHQGVFLGIAATGKPVDVWGVVIDVVRDGRFAESRLIMDTLGLMQQLGVIPTPSPAN
jgi:steroid delta-isomerase-like uncharacterized protein